MISNGDILQIDLVNTEQGNPKIIDKIRSAFSGKILTAATDGKSHLTLEFNTSGEIGKDSKGENVVFETFQVPKELIENILLNGQDIKLKPVIEQPSNNTSDINGIDGGDNQNMTIESENPTSQKNNELDGYLGKLFRKVFSKKKKEKV